MNITPNIQSNISGIRWVNKNPDWKGWLGDQCVIFYCIAPCPAYRPVFRNPCPARTLVTQFLELIYPEYLEFDPRHRQFYAQFLQQFTHPDYQAEIDRNFLLLVRINAKV